MTTERENPPNADIERAAAERRRSLEQPEEPSRPDPSGLFNAVEGVAPDWAIVPDKEGR